MRGRLSHGTGAQSRIPVHGGESPLGNRTVRRQGMFRVRLLLLQLPLQSSPGAIHAGGQGRLSSPREEIQVSESSSPTLHLSSGPHIFSGRTTAQIMWMVNLS